MTYSPWTGTSASTGDSSYQLSFANTTGVNASGQPKLSIRNGIDSTWNAWYVLLHSGNVGSYALPLSGGTMTNAAVVRFGLDDNLDRTAGATRTRFSLAPPSHTGAEWTFVTYDDDSYANMRFGYGDANTLNLRNDGYLTVAGNLILNSSNYNSYSPTLTGGSASGTWGISVTGNAGTATNVGGLVANSYTSYGGSATTNAPGGYYGLLFGTSTAHTQTMYDGAGNGGEYNQGFGWISYFLKSSSSLGIMASTTSASYALYVSGSIYATASITAYSDRRAKKDIETIDNALDKTNQLRGVYYRAIEEQVHDKSHHGKRLMGVIAQEVLEVVPEVVTYDKENDKYGVSYANMVGLLIEAVKELSEKVTEQDTSIAKLEALVNKLIRE